MATKKGKKRTKTMVSSAISLSLVLMLMPQTVFAGDTWPFKGDSAHGVNEPNVHGYTSGQIANWNPETDPDAELLRSRVPLQKRIEPFAATQANPNLDPRTKMITVAGDYGNAFIENAPYTNKFAQYHFNFWQYIDYYAYWHGTATAYTPPGYYDNLAQSDWQQKWFEFGMLNIPNPTYTDAAHKNGVKSLACIFLSNNDRGQQTYKQMIVKDENGKFPVAEKLIEMAKYFGYDGYFVNQEEASPNVAVADIPDYKAFLRTLQEGGLYVQWYDSLNTATGANTFARTFNNNNISLLYDTAAGKNTSNSFFFDYGVGSTQINSARTYLGNLNATAGTNFNLYDVGFAGLEGGRDRFKSVQGTALKNKLVNGIPQLSIATLGADFVHAGLDEDMGLAWPVSHRSENNYQWMTNLREQLWWSGPNVNPKNTTVSSTNTVSDVYADNRYWPGIDSVITERSVIQNSNFYTNFNTGHGLSYYKDGAVSNPDEWSNMSLQDVPVTWQWWEDTEGNRLTVDFDYGPDYDTSGTDRMKYQKVGGFNGGSSLVINGDLDKENFLHLYKSDLTLNDNSELSIAYDKVSADDESAMQVGLIFEDQPDAVVKVAVPESGKKTEGWVTKKLDLSSFAGKKLAAFGLVFTPGEGTAVNYQMNVGQIRIYDGSAAKPGAPTGLAITQAITNTNEVQLNWDLNTDYSTVKQYNVYVNDVYVGGKYDDVFYIKHLPARSGTIKVVAVGADGQEGEAATAAYDLDAAATDIQTDSNENGTFTVNWSNPASVEGEATVTVKSVNWITTPEPVSKQIVVPAGATSAVFDQMPINGDEYRVTVKIGQSETVTYNGTFTDKIAEPYAEHWTTTGNTINLPMPNTRDWRYVYIYEDGKPKLFATTYSVGNKPMIIRGRSTKASLSFTSTAKVVSAVMEDYSGNQSTPVYLKGFQNIIFDGNGGNPAQTEVQALIGNKLTMPTVTRAGYMLDGWYNGETRWDFDTMTVQGDLTLQARWITDNAAPVTKLTTLPTEPDGLNGWYVHPVELQLTASDELSGVVQTEYSVDGGETWLPYADPITLSEDAATTILYRSTDAAGNIETAQESLIQLDVTGPTVTSSINEGDVFTDSQTINPQIVVVDTGSGVDTSKTTITLDGERLQSGDKLALSGLTLDNHVLVVEASDNAGNAVTITVHFQTTASLDSLRALVDSFRADGSIDNGGIANSLMKKLEKGNLNSFVNEVSAQSGKHISEEAAEVLLRDANYLIQRNP
ncbi:endo-beta-N-acetylglucosaminidase [Paenibacillus albus]|uniref:Cytosolic endo-beta-N-acetylglucosaminidase TIM barrel domain-containing protein n=1 Tax=Paenibacillus albus TaxID=2495582 RepID=A0A3Q8X9A4_9BACL|nr:InlB B-repeat-containing protein [Paenibacillus albus]AZN42923.1 hypothetical protein EJC50_26915 [Paenibacillus albus]